MDKYAIKNPEYVCKAYCLDGRPCTAWHKLCVAEPDPSAPPAPQPTIAEPAYTIACDLSMLPECMREEAEELMWMSQPPEPEIPKIATNYCTHHQDESIRRRGYKIHYVKTRMENALRKFGDIQHMGTRYTILRSIQDKPMMLVLKKRKWMIRRMEWFTRAKAKDDDLLDTLIYAPRKTCDVMKISRYAFIFLRPDAKRLDGTCYKTMRKSALKPSDLYLWDPHSMYFSQEPKLVLAETTPIQCAAINKTPCK